MKHGTTNPIKKNLILELKKTKSGAWKRVAELLEKARRKNISVNLWKIEKLANEGKIIIVPGKVLGIGEISKKNEVAAISFSDNAKKKLEKLAISISSAVKKDKEGKNIQILV